MAHRRIDQHQQFWLAFLSVVENIFGAVDKLQHQAFLVLSDEACHFYLDVLLAIVIFGHQEHQVSDSFWVLGGDDVVEAVLV